MISPDRANVPIRLPAEIISNPRINTSRWPIRSPMVPDTRPSAKPVNDIIEAIQPPITRPEFSSAMRCPAGPRGVAHMGRRDNAAAERNPQSAVVFSSGKGTDIRKLSPVRLDPSIPVGDDAKQPGRIENMGTSPRRGQGHLPIFV